jgi:hypothetical protein
MKCRFVLLLGTGVLAVLLVRSCIAAPDSEDGISLADMLGSPGSVVSFLDATSRRNWLEDQLEESNGRIARKSEIAVELAAGRLTLLEAAARFHELHRIEPPKVRELRQRVHRDASEEECACREAIESLTHRMPKGHEVDPALVDRLRKELEKHRRRGTLKLPPPADRRGP